MNTSALILLKKENITNHVFYKPKGEVLGFTCSQVCVCFIVNLRQVSFKLIYLNNPKFSTYCKCHVLNSAQHTFLPRCVPHQALGS